jgi:hypothetical protein
MGSICLRRTKEVNADAFSRKNFTVRQMRDENGNALVALPPVEVTVVQVVLNEDERRLYDDVLEES